MSFFQSLNLAIRFFIEVVALIIYFYWGYTLGEGKIPKYLLAIGIMVIVAIIWGTFLSPKAPVELSPLLHQGLEIVILSIPVVIFIYFGYFTYGIAYAVIAVVNKWLMVIWGQ